MAWSSFTGSVGSSCCAAWPGRPAVSPALPPQAARRKGKELRKKRNFFIGIGLGLRYSTLFPLAKDAICAYLTNKLGIRSIPALMIFQSGERKWQGMGVQNLGVLKQQLEKLVE